MVPLKYLSIFWRILEIKLIIFEFTSQLKWSRKCFSFSSSVANQEPTFAITDTRLYVPVVTLSTQDHVKLVKQP